jgi:hypothetical protein
MKPIKKTLMLLALILTFSTSFAQSVASKELLCKKWIVDDESMKPILMKMIKENPMAEQISGTKIEYKMDGTTAKVAKSGNSNGSWSLSTDGKELTTKNEGKPDRVFSFAEISKTKLILLSADGKNIVFKPE